MSNIHSIDHGDSVKISLEVTKQDGTVIPIVAKLEFPETEVQCVGVVKAEEQEVEIVPPPQPKKALPQKENKPTNKGEKSHKPPPKTVKTEKTHDKQAATRKSKRVPAAKGVKKIAFEEEEEAEFDYGFSQQESIRLDLFDC